MAKSTAILGCVKKSGENVQKKPTTVSSRKISHSPREYAKNASSFFDSHSIKNLALLDKNTNSLLGNKNFKKKRKEIIEIDKNRAAKLADILEETVVKIR